MLTTRSTSPIRSVRSAGSILLVALLGLSACAERSDPLNGERSYAVHELSARFQGRSQLHTFDTLEEALPNVLYTDSAGRGSPLSISAVVGRVVSAEDGRAFLNASPESEEVPFDDRRADWRTIHLHIEVDQVLGGQPFRDLTVGIAIGAATDPGRMETGLTGLGHVVLLVTPPDAVFDYDTEVHPLLGGGELIATVDDEGRLALPMIDGTTRGRVLGDIRTVDDLARAARDEERAIAVDELGERVG
jgi:hypothetical protein